MSKTNNEWSLAETETHQDHVIAHVIGARIQGYFVFDEALHLILDMGFLWTIYLDGQMAMLPTGVALAELDMPEEQKQALRDEVAELGEGGQQFSLLTPSLGDVTIKSVEFYQRGESRRIIVEGEKAAMEIESSLAERGFKVSVNK